MEIKEPTAVPMHYWMASAEVYYCPKGKMAEGVTPATVNVIFTTALMQINSKDLGKAQQGAQQQFFQRAGEIQIDIVDVVFNTISHLGLMTAEDFLGPDLKQGLADGMAAATAPAKH